MPKESQMTTLPPVDFVTLPEMRALPELAALWQEVLSTAEAHNALHDRRMRLRRDIEALQRDAEGRRDEGDSGLALLQSQLPGLDAEVRQADTARGASHRKFNEAYSVAVAARMPELREQYLKPIEGLIAQSQAALTVAKLLPVKVGGAELWRRHWQAQLDYASALRAALIEGDE